MITPQQIAEEVLGEGVRWTDEAGIGYCRCPGEKHHTTTTGEKDCRVILTSESVVLHCFHQNCWRSRGSARMEIIARMEEAQAAGELEQGAVDFEALERTRLEAEERKAKTYEFRQMLPALIVKHRWPVEEILATSPDQRVRDLPATHFHYHLDLFAPTDIVWMGEVRDSGRPWHANRFRTADTWRRSPSPPFPFICASTFKAGSDSRSHTNVVKRKYLVLESDTMEKDAFGAVLNWLRQREGYKLHAVVDTGGKSLHGWFAFPSEEQAAQLRPALQAFECDPATWRPGQPVRVAGKPRRDAWQKLIYLDVP